MNTNSPQFSGKGTSPEALQKSALTQRIQEMDTSRGMTPEQQHARDISSGVAGARNAVNLGTTVKEATESPSTLGGPVSGAALAKAKASKSSAKRTAEREKKRR